MLVQILGATILVRPEMNNIFKLSTYGDVEWLMGTKPPPHEDEDYDGYEGYFKVPARKDLGDRHPSRYWRFHAFQCGGIKRSSVLIMIELQENYLNDRDQIKAIDETRKIFQEANLLYRPACAAEIAKPLGDLADILNQELSEKAAHFIIGLFMKAEMPPLLVNHICHHIACHENGRLKPLIFNLMIQRAKIRYQRMRKILEMYDDAYRIFDEALKLALEKEPGVFGSKEQLEF